MARDLYRSMDAVGPERDPGRMSALARRIWISPDLPARLVAMEAVAAHSVGNGFGDWGLRSESLRRLCRRSRCVVACADNPPSVGDQNALSALPPKFARLRLRVWAALRWLRLMCALQRGRRLHRRHALGEQFRPVQFLRVGGGHAECKRRRDR